jgi:large subunit ribosomal protein L9
VKLILTADVSNLGAPGDIVEVKDGYGRNYLLPRRLAIPATRGAEKQVAAIRKARQAREIRDLGHAQEVAATLQGMPPVRLTARAAADTGRLFGSVTPADVVEALRAAGGPRLDRRAVSLEQQIKTVGRHTVSVRLHPEVIAEFPVEVTAAT